MMDSIDTLIAFAMIFTLVSLLITIVVQWIVSLVNLRGHNLAWGVAEAFEIIVPELKADLAAKRLADHLLEDRLISDSQIWNWVGKANAIRGEELFALLHGIATGKRPNTPPEIRESVLKLFKHLGVPPEVLEWTPEEEAKAQALRNDLITQLKLLQEGPVRKHCEAKLSEVEGQLQSALHTAEEVSARWVAMGDTRIQSIYSQFLHWFEIGQERSQEWFTTHTRLITILLAFAAAVILQLDAVEIYKWASSNRVVRDQLVAQSNVVLNQGEGVLKRNTDPETLKRAWSATTNGNPILSKVTLTIGQGDTLETVKSKIMSAGSASPSMNATQTLAQFDKEVATSVTNDLARLGREYTEMVRTIEKSGFELFPKSGWRWEHEERRDKSSGALRVGLGHVLGMIVSALLLSLGAPFWFNCLKSLSSLRSVVARNISEEQRAQTVGGKVREAEKAPIVVR